MKLTQEQFTQFVKEFVEYTGSPTLKWRTGQCAFNALYNVNPDIANQIAGTNIDPFYDSGKMNEFIEAISPNT